MTSCLIAEWNKGEYKSAGNGVYPETFYNQECNRIQHPCILMSVWPNNPIMFQYLETRFFFNKLVIWHERTYKLSFLAFPNLLRDS